MPILELDPIEGVLAILNDGAATGTNKMGLLLALIDIAPVVGETACIDVSLIAEKLIELHWDHARPYGEQPLRQVASGNRSYTTVILEVMKLRETLGNDMSFEVARPRIREQDWRVALSAVTRATAKNPLPLLQRLPGNPPPFLYEYDVGAAGTGKIRFVDGALDALIRYGPVLRDLVEFRFVRFVVNVNFKSLGFSAEDQIAEHLFGSKRHMPPQAMRHELWMLQGGRCIYTGQRLSDPWQANSLTSIDHVIPWKRVRLSAVENLLVTSSSTNSVKKATLLAPAMLSRWLAYLFERGEALSLVAESFGWPSDYRRVLAVAHAQYAHAKPTSPVWNGLEGISPLGDRGQVESVNMLR